MENGMNKATEAVRTTVNFHLVKDELVNTLDYAQNVREDVQQILAALGEEADLVKLEGLSDQPPQTLPERMSSINSQINSELGDIRSILAKLRQLVG